MKMSGMEYTAFIPQGENRRETARYLINLCKENDLDPHNVQSGNGGFNVTEAIADLIGDTTDPDGEKNSLANTGLDPDEEGSSEGTSDHQAGQEPAVAPEASDAATKAGEPPLEAEPDPLPNGAEEQVSTEENKTAPKSRRGRGKSA